MHTYSPRLPGRSQDWITSLSLSLSSRALLLILDRTPRRFLECWRPLHSLAAALGLCIRTIERCLAELESHSIILRVKDYSLKSRHRIVLLWRNPTVAVTPTEETQDVRPAVIAQVAPTPELPTPEPEDQPPPPEPPSAPETPRRATREEIDLVVSKAERHFRRPCRGQIMSLSRRSRLLFVHAAVNAAIGANATSWSYVETCLNEWWRDKRIPKTQATWWQFVRLEAENISNWRNLRADNPESSAREAV